MAREMRVQQAPQNPPTGPVFDLLLHYLTCEVARQLVETNSSPGLSDDSLDARLQRIETRLEQLSLDSDGGAEEEEGEENDDTVSGTSTSDLSNESPKYAKIDSMLKYIEGDEDAKGIKLVIMNFND